VFLTIESALPDDAFPPASTDFSIIADDYWCLLKKMQKNYLSISSGNLLFTSTNPSKGLKQADTVM